MKQKILEYDAIFEEQPEGDFTVTVPSHPGCISEGYTLEEAKTTIADAITAYIESLAKDSEKNLKANLALLLIRYLFKVQFENIKRPQLPQKNY